MNIPSFTIHYTPSREFFEFYLVDDYFDFDCDEHCQGDCDVCEMRYDDPFGLEWNEDSYPVGVMVPDPDTGDTLIAMINENNPVAPDFYNGTVEQVILNSVLDFFHAADGADKDADYYLGTEISLVENPTVEADDAESAIPRLMETHVLTPLGLQTMVYETFTLDFRTNIRSEQHFPIGIFSYCAQTGELSANLFNEGNPFEPATLRRAQRKLIARQLEEFMGWINRGEVQQAFDTIRRPQFGIFKVGEYRAYSSRQAVEIAEKVLADLYLNKGAA